MPDGASSKTRPARGRKVRIKSSPELGCNRTIFWFDAAFLGTEKIGVRGGLALAHILRSNKDIWDRNTCDIESGRRVCPGGRGANCPARLGEIAT
jgi:hypothetical protein